MRLKREILAYEVKIKKMEKGNQCHDIMDSMEKLHESLKERHFRIEKFIQNPGLQHIALAIFKNLDPKSLGNCRVVSKEWKACIDQDKYWWNLQLVKCKEIIEIAMTRNDDPLWNGYGFPGFPEFLKTMDHIYEKESMENLQLFAAFMSSYQVKITKIEYWYWETPLHFAADENRIDIFDMLVKSPHMNNMNVDSIQLQEGCKGLQRTLLGHACFNNQVDVVEFFMNLEGDKKVDFNKMPFWGFSLFHCACLF